MSVAQGKESSAGGARADEKKTAEPVAESLVPDTPGRFRLRRHGALPADEKERAKREAGTRAQEVAGDADQLDDREGNGRQHHMRARISELETELARLREQPPDLTKFGETELAVMASDAAASILRTAMRAVEEAAAKAREKIETADGEVKTMRASAQRDADLLRRSASQDSTRMREAAKTEADATRKEAETEAAAKLKSAEHARGSAAKEVTRIQAEATAAAEATRKEAESAAAAKVKQAEDLRRAATKETSRLRDEAAAAATTIHKEAESRAAEALSKAHAEAAALLHEATERRDALVADLEVQRRFIVSMLEQATELERSFADSYQHFRKVLDETASHLSAPIERAKRQLAHIDRELKKEE